MLLNKEQIRDAAMKLQPVEREILAEELLLSIDSNEREKIDAAWLVEVRRRDAEFSQGKISAKPVEEILAQLESKGRP
jgi:putative addiction module component (TIGR02574 family)